MPESRISILSRNPDTGAIKNIRINFGFLSKEEIRTHKIFLRFAFAPLTGHVETETWGYGFIQF